MHVAAVQFDIVWEDKPANHALIEEMLTHAQLPPGTFVVLPELGDTGFSFDLDRICDDLTLPWAKDVASRLGVWMQVGHAERAPDGRGRNCATIVDPEGRVMGTYQKVHPFSYSGETQRFSSGEHLLTAQCGEMSVCPQICYDLRFPELWRLGVQAGAEVFTIGASWPKPRQAHWRALLIARAIENQAFVVAVNRVGSDPNLPYGGGSIIISPEGAVVAEADDEPCVLEADLDPGSLRDWRRQFPALADLQTGLMGQIRTERAGESG